jgi:hypothetical protein
MYIAVAPTTNAVLKSIANPQRWVTTVQVCAELPRSLKTQRSAKNNNNNYNYTFPVRRLGVFHDDPPMVHVNGWEPYIKHLFK